MIDYDKLHRVSLFYAYDKIVDKYLKAYPELSQLIKQEAFELHRVNVEKHYKKKCCNSLGFVPDDKLKHIMGNKPSKASYQDLYHALQIHRNKLAKLLNENKETPLPRLYQILDQRLKKNGIKI